MSRACADTAASAAKSPARQRARVWMCSAPPNISTPSVTLASASSMDKDFEGFGGNIEAAKKVGNMIAKKAAEKGITKAVYDRGGFVYHGRVKALAEGAREGGLEL